jgi:hypothetical protein
VGEGGREGRHDRSDKVIDALPGIEAPNLTGGVSKMLPNHHITKPVLIGEIRRRPVRRGVEDQGSRARRRLVELPARLEGSRSPTGSARSAATTTPFTEEVPGRLGVAGDKVYYSAADGKTFEAASNAAVDAPLAEASVVRVNNRVRRALETALGSLTLLSPDTARRQQAADAVFRSRDASAKTALINALTAEGDPRVRRTMEEALAVLTLAAPGAPTIEVLGAIKTLRERGDQDALSVLRAAASTIVDAGPRAAAASAISDIEGRSAQNVWYGLSLGSVLLLAAIGLPSPSA